MADTFEYNHRTYTLFDHPNNLTIQNERAVEIPIAARYYTLFPSRDTLEVGNVLAQYGWPGHDCVDKVEGPIKADITTWNPERRYLNCVCISTLEHIADFRAALKNMQRLCSVGLVTWPIGWNAELDAARHELPFQRVHYMERLGEGQWAQVAAVPEGVAYGKPFPNGNLLVLAYW